MKILMFSVIVIFLIGPGKCEEEETNEYYDNPDNDLLNQLVNDCNAPIKYLEKRGYLQKGKLKPIELSSDSNGKSENPRYQKNFFYFPKQSNEKSKVKKSDTNEKHFLDKNAKIYIASPDPEKSDTRTAHLIQKLSNGATAAVIDGSEDESFNKDRKFEDSIEEDDLESKDDSKESDDKQTSFFKKVGNKFMNLFGSKEQGEQQSSASLSNNYLEDINFNDNTFNGLYSDDSGFDDDLGMYNDFLMPDPIPGNRVVRSGPLGSNAGTDSRIIAKLSLDKNSSLCVNNNESNNSCVEPNESGNKTSAKTNSTQASTKPTNSSAGENANKISNDTKLNEEELFKNLSEIDRSYVKGFVHCYLENKKQFITDILRAATGNQSIEWSPQLPSITISNSTSNNVNITTVDVSNSTSKTSNNQNSTSNSNSTMPNVNNTLTSQNSSSPENATLHTSNSTSNVSTNNTLSNSTKVDNTTLSTNSTSLKPYETSTNSPKNSTNSSSIYSPSSNLLRPQNTSEGMVSSILSSMIAKQNNHRNRYILNFSPFARPVRFYLRNHESLKKPKSCHNYKKKKPIPHIKKQHHPHCNHKPRKKLKKVQKTKKLETTEDCSSYPDSHNFDTILKFLAHLHHQVDEVGKPPHKALDLKKVESMIESCKHLTAKSAVLGSGQSTECAPLELNDLSIDMEWNELGGGSSSTTNAANGKNGVKARKVFDEIFKQGNRGAQSDDTLYLYLDEEDEKKEPPVKRSTNQKVDKVISDISSSLHKFKTRKRNPKFNAVYSDDDLSSLDTSDYEYSEKDDEDDECVALNTVKGQKANRRKAAKPKKKKSSKSEKPLRENEEHKDPDDQNPFRHFSELNDIQFRVNPDQEQDIATFIENLNTPPEIFSFDVEKYMKPEIESSAPNREFVDEPKRQYYEFIETPNIDSEPVPLIPPTYQESESNLKVLNKKGNAEAPIKKRSYGKSQRDLLRQYIKGVSSSLIGQNLPLASESTSSNKDGKPAKNFDSLNGENESKEAESKESLSPDRERENISNRAKALIENYGNNLYAMNYVKYGNNDKASDDFIDNYYLLNDGSYKKEEPAPTHSNKYSSYDIQIDRDLDKKFADLNYQKTGDLNIHNYPILKPIDEEETKESGQNVDKL